MHTRWLTNMEYGRTERHQFTDDQRLAMVFRVYNAGSVPYGMRKKLMETDNVKVLDPGTNRPKQNYVSTLTSLYAYCFSRAVYQSN
jgi:hypothetical protein